MQWAIYLRFAFPFACLKNHVTEQREQDEDADSAYERRLHFLAGAKQPDFMPVQSLEVNHIQPVGTLGTHNTAPDVNRFAVRFALLVFYRMWRNRASLIVVEHETEPARGSEQ